MAISARSRRGTSASFWRHHNAMQMMLAQACMPSIRTIPPTRAARVEPVAPVCFPTPIQRNGIRLGATQLTARRSAQ
jgi:hypothetical protein